MKENGKCTTSYVDYVKIFEDIMVCCDGAWCTHWTPTENNHES